MNWCVRRFTCSFLNFGENLSHLFTPTQMQRRIAVFCSVSLLLLLGSFSSDPGWTTLLDKDLTQWEMYLSYRHSPGYKGEIPRDEKGDTILPIGYNRNVNGVFTVQVEQGEPVLKISGEIYGCVFTKQDFENYHLKLKVRWGNKKWNPRLEEDMDSGILYHSQGKCGVDYWRSWMLSQELQIIEKSMGDYWSIAHSQIDIKASKPKDQKEYRFDGKGQTVSFGMGTGNSNFCQSSENVEKPKGEWNTVELICFGDKSVYVVNGKVVMALSNSRSKEGAISRPLSKGKLQLQSEAAEVYYKDIKIKNIPNMPKEYSSYF